MNIQLLYFGALAEALGRSSETFSTPDTAITLGELKEQLLQRGTPWQALNNKSLHMAVNQTLCKAQTTLEDGDEVAFFPPVTGG